MQIHRGNIATFVVAALSVGSLLACAGCTVTTRSAPAPQARVVTYTQPAPQPVVVNDQPGYEPQYQPQYRQPGYFDSNVPPAGADVVVVFGVPADRVSGPPPGWERGRRARYHHHDAYYVGGRWYVQAPQGWLALRHEPQELSRTRVVRR